MLEATVIFPPTIPIGPVVSPGAAPSKDSSVPALQPTRRTIVTATTKAKTSTAGRWLLDRLVTVNYPPVFCPLSRSPTPKRQYSYASASGQALWALPDKEAHATHTRYREAERRTRNMAK